MFRCCLILVIVVFATGCDQLPLPLDIISPGLDPPVSGTWEVSDNSVTVVFDPVELSIYGVWRLVAINNDAVPEANTMTFTRAGRFAWVRTDGQVGAVSGSFVLGENNTLTLDYDGATFTPNNATGTDEVTWAIEGNTLTFQFARNNRSHTYVRVLQ